MPAIYFSLSYNIEQHKFLQKVLKLISNEKDLNNKILKIEIIEINQEHNISQLLEHKN